MLDAPVSGGDVSAKAGTLSIMIGVAGGRGERRDGGVASGGQEHRPRRRCRRAGQACKACNQIAVVCSLMGVCESIALAKKCGLDVNKMIEVVGGARAVPGNYQTSARRSSTATSPPASRWIWC
ncbi:MAG: NAD-binding protein [Phycisphaerales bacterium]